MFIKFVLFILLTHAHERRHANREIREQFEKERWSYSLQPEAKKKDWPRLDWFQIPIWLENHAKCVLTAIFVWVLICALYQTISCLRSGGEDSSVKEAEALTKDVKTLYYKDASGAEWPVAKEIIL